MESRSKGKGEPEPPSAHLNQAIREREARKVQAERRSVLEEARHRFDVCARFAEPGSRSLHPERDESPAVLFERFCPVKNGDPDNPNWEAVNLEFSRQWVDHHWMECAALARTALGASRIQRMKELSGAAREARRLFLRLVTAPDPIAVSDSVVEDLAQARMALGLDRFLLQDFFRRLPSLVDALLSGQGSQEGHPEVHDSSRVRPPRRHRASSRPGWIYRRDAEERYGVARSTLYDWSKKNLKDVAKTDEESGEIMFPIEALEAVLRQKNLLRK